MSRVVKSFLSNGPGISGHREHRSKKGRKRHILGSKVIKCRISYKTRKLERKELRDTLRRTQQYVSQ